MRAQKTSYRKEKELRRGVGLMEPSSSEATELDKGKGREKESDEIVNKELKKEMKTMKLTGKMEKKVEKEMKKDVEVKEQVEVEVEVKVKMIMKKRGRK
ncbi:hypothetical protein Syun_001186 [Stephania yunnanensis]|uniref:Uncharacterized protein n=1 Tax=Stephania yunnanensis TaxID=152371 RepID=A0AAP0QAM8_9MAGN